MSAREGSGKIVKKVSAPAVREASCFCHSLKVTLISFPKSCLFKGLSDHQFHRGIQAVQRQGVCLRHVLEQHRLRVSTHGRDQMPSVGYRHCNSHFLTSVSDLPSHCQGAAGFFLLIFLCVGSELTTHLDHPFEELLILYIYIQSFALCIDSKNFYVSRRNVHDSLVPLI